MIPEKWDKIYLYSSVIDEKNGQKKGELYFYYIPKGILKKKPVNVYEIPYKFNLDENDYLKLVKILFNKIKLLREEFRKSETGSLWSNLTMIIGDMKFKVEYNYDDLKNSMFSSYERHIIWRYKYLGIGEEQLNKKEKDIIERYLALPKRIGRKEEYETGLYITEVENKIAYNTENKQEQEKYEVPDYDEVQKDFHDDIQNNRFSNETSETKVKRYTVAKRPHNQLLLSEEQIREYEKRKNEKQNN